MSIPREETAKEREIRRRNVFHQQSYLPNRRLFDRVLIGLTLCLVRLGVDGATFVELTDDVSRRSINVHIAGERQAF